MEDGNIEEELRALQLKANANQLSNEKRKENLKIKIKIEKEKEASNKMSFPLSLSIDYTARDIQIFKDSIAQVTGRNYNTTSYMNSLNVSPSFARSSASCSSFSNSFATSISKKIQKITKSKSTKKSSKKSSTKDIDLKQIQVYPLLTSTSSIQDWNNQVHLRGLAKSLHLPAGGTNEQMRSRIRNHKIGYKIIQNAEIFHKNNPNTDINQSKDKKRKREHTTTVISSDASIIGKQCILTNGYLAKEKYLGSHAVISGGIQAGGWYEVKIVSSNNIEVRSKNAKC